MKIKTILLISLTAFIGFSFTPSEIYASGQREKARESRNFFALGTTCSVALYIDRRGNAVGSEHPASEIFDAAEEQIDSIENAMSVKIEDSEINRVNMAAGSETVHVSSDVYEVITEGLRFSQLSGGAFDISIGPLVALWDIGGEGTTVPPAEDIKAALKLVDYRKIVMRTEPLSIYLPEAGMRLEPGGVAKGFAADKTAALLKEAGVESALINLGGNVLAMGLKPDGSPWKIGVQNPFNARGDYIGVLETSDMAIVSSGKYERFFIENEVRYHHILSTKDGFPIENGIAQVTIVCPESMTADAMSTTVFSLGLEKGLELIKKIAGTEAIIITEKKEIYLTGGLAEKFNLTDNSFTIVAEQQFGE